MEVATDAMSACVHEMAENGGPKGHRSRTCDCIGLRSRPIRVGGGPGVRALGAGRHRRDAHAGLNGNLHRLVAERAGCRVSCRHWKAMTWPNFQAE